MTRSRAGPILAYLRRESSTPRRKWRRTLRRHAFGSFERGSMTSKTADRPRDKHRKALVADDDDDTRTLFARCLRGVGFSVLEAADGEQLMDVFGSTWASNPAQQLVVISDIGMPERNGIEATRLLRQTAPNVPVILVTAFSDPNTLQAAHEAGATRVMLKPVNRATFVEAALQALEATADAT